MRTIDEGVSSAPPDICFAVARDVERWSEILPHYRWVRFHRKDGEGEGVVEMAAWRHFPLIPWPTWWVSRMSSDPGTRRVHYEHIDGITKGMVVEWAVTPTPDGGSALRVVHDWEGPGWPLIGGFAANRVIGPWFINHIAGRTLAGVARAAERDALRRGDD